MEKIIIIGGGVAGLSCLNALLDKGVDALLIDGGAIGSPKMCGEFLAPAAVEQLTAWNIGPIQEIKTITFNAKNKIFDLTLPLAAGALARSYAERALAERAIKKGGRIKENNFIKQITPSSNKSPYRFTLASGEVVESHAVFFATGKVIPERMQPHYRGIKLHLAQSLNPETLAMQSIKGGYFGLITLPDKTSNLACLIRQAEISKYSSVNAFYEQVIAKNLILKGLMAPTIIDWLEAPVPPFQLKQQPAWPNSWWLGDALAGIYPAIGYGFAHSITSAICAVDCYLQNDPQRYVLTMQQNLKVKLRIGRLLHHVLSNPELSSYSLSILKFKPLINYFLRILFCDK